MSKAVMMTSRVAGSPSDTVFNVYTLYIKIFHANLRYLNIFSGHSMLIKYFLLFDTNT